MKISIRDDTKTHLSKLKDGISEIRLYKFHDYVTVVSFVLLKESLVTVRAKENYIGPRFEVFTITASDEKMNVISDKVLKFPVYAHVTSISILSKYTWAVLASEDDKMKMMGEPTGATIQSEGIKSALPENAVNSAKVKTGVEIKLRNGSSFVVVASVNPFDLSVNDEISCLKLLADSYEHEILC